MAWGKDVLLALGLGPMLLAMVYRIVPAFPRNLDDPLLALAVIWLLILMLIITPARIWDEQRRKIEEAADLQTPPALADLFRGAQIEHSTMNFYLSDRTGSVVSSEGSNTVIRTSEYEAVLYRGGTVSAQAQAAIGRGTASDATVRIESGD